VPEGAAAGGGVRGRGGWVCGGRLELGVVFPPYHRSTVVFTCPPPFRVSCDAEALPSRL
jgi:hypothetical protein